MLKDCKSARDGWGEVSEQVDSWLNERQELLVFYCSLSGIEPLRVDDRPFSVKMRHFCQLLVDYVSAGHFGIYEQLQRSVSDVNDNEALTCASTVLNSIQKTTEFCLDFNDGIDKFSDIQSLQAALSKLGECLEERFFLEDQLVEALDGSCNKSVEPVNLTV
ncbi:MAG: sigma D regulator [Endozoicomonadaceae bacterium]|nr:sigma D regulator [Endozoicomonadaceae bacterium]